MALEPLIRAFSEREEPFAKALYWIGGPRGWAVHVPKKAREHGYVVYRHNDLVTALTMALTGEGGVPEGAHFDQLAAQQKRGVVEPYSSDDDDWGSELV